MPRPERAFRSPAIVLNRRDFGEADRLLTLLTPKHGKISGIAKGARKPTSTKTGHVELFTKTDVLVHRGRDLAIIVQAELVEPYLGIREDLQRGAYANYAVELLDRFTEGEDEDMQRVFALLDGTLKTLCDDDDPRRVIRWYEMHLLDLLGFRPELNECIISREPVRPRHQFFSYAGGGVVSPDYVHQGEQTVKLPLKTLKVMRHLQRSAYKDVYTLQIPLALHNDLERIMLGYITFLLERQLQSVDFIRRVRQIG